jgi:hypothetical protein
MQRKENGMISRIKAKRMQGRFSDNSALNNFTMRMTEDELVLYK